MSERFDMWILHRLPFVSGTYQTKKVKTKKLSSIAFLIVFAAIIGYGVLKSAILLADVPLGQWFQIGEGLAATALGVFIFLIIALAWTIPLGVAIGMNPRLSKWLQPVVQIVASVPATALFPVFVLMLIALPGGLNFAPILLMLMGTQWYLLFNIIAGVSIIPQDLKYTADMLGLSRSKRWKILILPAIFPYLITGAITASGGAWNASIVAEYVEFSGKTLRGVNPYSTIVFQTFALLPRLTVLENVEIALKARMVPKKIRIPRAVDLLDKVGLDGFETAFETAYPRELSGGGNTAVNENTDNIV